MSIKTVTVKIERNDSGTYAVRLRVSYDAASPVNVSKTFDTPGAALAAVASMVDAAENGGALA